LPRYVRAPVYTVPLAEDLLVGVRAIAAFTGESERRIRHLISRHELPSFKRGGLFYARKSALNAYYGGEGGAPASNGGGR
jgi:hypothetical protein